MIKTNKDNLAYLWRRYLDDASSETELKALESALHNPDLKEDMDLVLEDIFLEIPEGDVIDMSGTVAKDRSLNYILKQAQAKRTVKLWPRVAIAAAMVITLGFWFYSSNPFVNPVAEMANEKDISPGQNLATITMSNGKTINLSNAKTGVRINASSLEYNDGTAVEAAKGLASVPRNDITVSTPNGGTYQIALPDGTKVWLNAASSIKFPSGFQTLAIRNVELIGEAYFEVAKDKKHPFVVKTKLQELEVLGTHFNINCYPEEKATKTTLLEGSVKLNWPQLHIPETILVPNQQALWAGNHVEVIPADLEAVMAWKHGDFVFKGEDFRATMRKIARWYDVDIVYEADLDEHIELGGWVSRNSKLSEVLSRIELAGNVHFKVEGRRVFVRK